ncbi:MAG: class I SAM-dependent methyltransferase [Nanoarchaeota archaeon]
MDLYYNNIINYNELYGEEQEQKLKIIKEYFGECKVLDVGCGTLLSKKYFKDVTGIDPTGIPPAIKGVAESLPFKDKEFDLVICVTVLHNVNNPEKAIQELKRVSKGKIAITLLKKSSKLQCLKELTEKYFKKFKMIEEKKDIIYLIKYSE